MNREELKEYMPHREPMLLLDEVDILDDGSVRARYRVPEDAFFLQGHFPGNPIVPGVILCEIMAQSCSFLAKDLLKGKTTLFSGIDKMRFKQIVHPSEVCEVTARLTNKRGMLFFCEASLSVEGKLCCRGELSFALACSPAARYWIR